MHIPNRFAGTLPQALSHSESKKLLENVQNVGIEILREEQRLQRRAVLLHLLVMLQRQDGEPT
jgi:hypothetical protein